MIIDMIITVVIVAIAVTVIAYAGRRADHRRQTRTSFGPEYARVKVEQGGARAADRELNRRIRIHHKLRLVPISADERDFYTTSWERVEGGFADDPVVTLSRAQRLIARLLAAKGYPAGEQEEQLALLSVQHGETLAGYCHAQSVAERVRIAPTRVTTEQKRTALTQYHVFFTDLLVVPGAAAPGRIRESGATP